MDTVERIKPQESRASMTRRSLDELHRLSGGKSVKALRAKYKKKK
jgi:hypothetical protein